MYGGWVVFLALLCGILRKFGKPVFAKTELRKYMFHQDFQMMGFMSCASMSHTTVVVMMYGPVFLHGYLVCGKIIEEHLKGDLPQKEL
jgi:hypothetical protein